MATEEEFSPLFRILVERRFRDDSEKIIQKMLSVRAQEELIWSVSVFFTKMQRQPRRQILIKCMKWRVGRSNGTANISQWKGSQTHLGLLHSELGWTGTGCAQKHSSGVTGDAVDSAPAGEQNCILPIGDVITRHCLGGDYLASHSSHSSVACTLTQKCVHRGWYFSALCMKVDLHEN